MLKKILKFSIIIFPYFVFLINHVNAHEINEKKIVKIIENFILKNPSLIKKSLTDLQKLETKNEFHKALNELKKIKNPSLTSNNSDLVIYEFFDYNCGYCKSVVKIIMDVLSEDKKINFVFVEFPILSQQSYFAAKAALASKKQDLYNKFHLSLMIMILDLV